MIATPLDLDIVSELRLIHKRRVRRRSKGRHLSQIIHYLQTKLEPGRYDQDPDIDLGPVFHMGFLLEDFFSEVLGQQFSKGRARQQEIELDGIFMTIDGFNAEDWRVVEFKATKMSAAHNPASNKFWHWRLRTSGYCRAMDTRQAELIAYHVNGSYELGGGRFGRQVFKPWLLEFTEREQEENWSTILRARDAMDREGIPIEGVA